MVRRIGLQAIPWMDQLALAPVGSVSCGDSPAAALGWIRRARGKGLQGRDLGVEDDGGGDVAVFGDEDIKSAAQRTVVHDFEADTLFAEQSEYLRLRKQLLLAGTEQYYRWF